MGSQDQTTRAERRANLLQAISDHHDAQQQAREDKHQEEREAREARLTADANLYGTAGWESLSPARREMAAAWSAQQAQGGGSDAA